MGAWETLLYANDSTSDVRGDYVNKLKHGKSNVEATQELIQENKDIIGDVEEESLFWFALADTQWDYGRLLPIVKEKALFFLSQDDELERWKESDLNHLIAWQNTLDMLRQKLNSPQPLEKKVSKYRLYRCKWQLGDVFAYRFSGQYSKIIGYEGKYIVFRKVSEDTWWPGHIVPVVQVFKRIYDSLPTLDALINNKLLEQGFYPEALTHKPDTPKKYLIKLLSTSERVIPKDNLIILGNISGNDLIPFRGHDYWTGYIPVGWDGGSYNNRFEQYILDMYIAWRGID